MNHKGDDKSWWRDGPLRTADQHEVGAESRNECVFGLRSLPASLNKSFSLHPICAPFCPFRFFRLLRPLPLRTRCLLLSSVPIRFFELQQFIFYFVCVQDIEFRIHNGRKFACREHLVPKVHLRRGRTIVLRSQTWRKYPHFRCFFLKLHSLLRMINSNESR